MSGSLRLITRTWLLLVVAMFTVSSLQAQTADQINAAIERGIQQI